jgi:hypothetical protein
MRREMKAKHWQISHGLHWKRKNSYLVALSMDTSPPTLVAMLVNVEYILWLCGRSAPLVRLGVRSQVDLLQEQELLQYATFLPAGGGVVFVHNNDLYHLDRLPDGHVTRVTSSGVAGTLYNGVADWLYEGMYSKCT